MAPMTAPVVASGDSVSDIGNAIEASRGNTNRLPFPPIKP